MADVQRQADQLARLIAEESQFLQRHGQGHFEEPLGRAAQLLREGRILAGAQAYLLLNRGLVDIMFHPSNGNAATEEEGVRLTDELSALHGRNFELADAIEKELRA